MLVLHGEVQHSLAQVAQIQRDESRKSLQKMAIEVARRVQQRRQAYPAHVPDCAQAAQRLHRFAQPPAVSRGCGAHAVAVYAKMVKICMRRTRSQ